jgi:hypothetical protein
MSALNVSTVVADQRDHGVMLHRHELTPKHAPASRIDGSWTTPATATRPVPQKQSKRQKRTTVRPMTPAFK